MPTVAASRLWTGHTWLEAGAVTIGEGRILAVGPARGPVPDRVLAPGFVDCQVNGIDDVDVNVAPDAVDWDRLDALLSAQGTTSWCPTLVSAPLDRYGPRLLGIARAAGAVPARRAAIVGAHLEGPFLGGLPGAHDPRAVQPIDLAWLAALPSVVRIVTLGPEQPLACEAARLLRDRGVVVAVGHSAADAAATERVIDAGARLATHLFNAMAPFGHRAPGIAAAVLADPRVTPSLIADGAHVDPTALRVAFAAKRDVILVTDSVAWRTGRFQGAGAEAATADDGGAGGSRSGSEARDGGADAGAGVAARSAEAGGPHDRRLVLGDDGVPRLVDGTLARSALTMDAAVRFVVERCGIPLGRALRSASTVPAALLGLHDRGVLAPGRRADLVALGPDLHVEAVWAVGAPVEP